MTERSKVDKGLIQDALVQVNYWLVRYEQSRDVNDLDAAIRHWEGIIPYLPSRMRAMGLFQLANVGYYMTPTSRREFEDE